MNSKVESKAKLTKFRKKYIKYLLDDFYGMIDSQINNHTREYINVSKINRNDNCLLKNGKKTGNHDSRLLLVCGFTLHSYTALAPYTTQISLLSSCTSDISILCF